MSHHHLTDIGVLVTRPLHQSDYLATRIEELGGKPWLFPTLEISASKNRQPLLDLIPHLGDYDLAVFVSPNAVENVMPLILADHTWPESVRAATVGKGSALALERYGIRNVIMPADGTDSEALLRMSQFENVQGQRVVVFRGNGGRKLLGDTLRERGAQVDYVECYCRSRPDIDSTSLLEYWNDGGIHAVIMTSSEGLNNLFDMVGIAGQQLLKATPMFTSHDRIAGKAEKLGVIKVCRTAAGDEGMVQGLLSYFNTV